ncbi:MAG: nickel-dependent lactate racemase [Chloroflexia bacterium]|nr:nickel-dependent lactate racemase [Chloroflexia bacterium]
MVSQWKVPFGRGTLSFQLPKEVRATFLEPPLVEPLDNPQWAADQALQHPLGTLPLHDLASGKRAVVIAVTDATRACPDALLVPPMLRALAVAGVPDDAVTILVAVGAHRASTLAEKKEKLGEEIVARYRVIDHDAASDDLVTIPGGPEGHPFRLNRRAVEADLLIATGIVEPHQYAGFSGGGKTVSIGCADEGIIAWTHGPAMLDDPATRLANLETNPFQLAVRRVARAAGLRFVANAVLGPEGRPIAIAYGDPERVQDHLADVARRAMTVAVPHQFDVAIAGVGYPKDENLYQASRAASYLQFAPVPVVRDGGAIIIPARCPEGAGEGVGERRFAASMRHPGGMDGIIDEARTTGIRPGAQRAYVMAQVLSSVEVIITGAVDPDVISALGFGVASDIGAGLDALRLRLGTKLRVLVVPHALTTLPVVTTNA